MSAGTDGFSESLLDTIRSQPGVAHAVPLLQQTVTVKDPNVRGERLLVLGVDMLEQEDQQFRKYGSAELDALRKDPLAFLNSPHNLLVSRSFAQRYQHFRRVGDERIRVLRRAASSELQIDRRDRDRVGVGIRQPIQRGAPRARQHHIATASTMFRELGMLFWSEQAERS